MEEKYVVMANGYEIRMWDINIPELKQKWYMILSSLNQSLGDRGELMVCREFKNPL